MAPEAPGWLAPVLLVLLASGAWARGPKILTKPEGSNVCVRCRHHREEWLKEKVWCQWTSKGSWTILPSSRVPAQDSRYSVKYDLQQNVTVMTMARLQVQDSGFYSCGIMEGSRFLPQKNFILVVTKATSPPITRKAPTVTAVDPAISIGIDSPPDDWTRTAIVVCAVVAVLLLLGLAILLVLYFSIARTGRGDSEPQHSYQDLPSEQEKDAVSRSFGQQLVGAICCASFIELVLPTEAPGDSSTTPALQPEPAWLPLREYNTGISIPFRTESRATEL